MSSIRLQVEQLAKNLVDRQWQVATAESCTGGGIGEAFTRISGSSKWFCGGVISYSNDLKNRLLGVDRAVLEQDGAVSRSVVTQMATGVRELTGADISVAVSGIAGPTGGDELKPVGLVWCGWSLRGHQPLAQRCRFYGTRHSIRQQTICEAVKGLLAIMN